MSKPDSMIWLGLLCLLSTLICTQAQLSPAEIAPLIRGLAEKPEQDASTELEKRVPLMTDDNTTSPLISLQVWAPPSVPEGSSCSVELLKHTFGAYRFNIFLNENLSCVRLQVTDPMVYQL
jgi:hypothetical protein